MVYASKGQVAQLGTMTGSAFYPQPHPNTKVLVDGADQRTNFRGLFILLQASAGPSSVDP